MNNTSEYNWYIVWKSIKIFKYTPFYIYKIFKKNHKLIILIALIILALNQ